MAEGEKSFNPESMTGKITVVPAEKDMGTKNCLVISERLTPTIEEVVRAAANNEARISSDGEEAGDDLYVVQFPGSDQKALSYDDLMVALRDLSGSAESE